MGFTLVEMIVTLVVLGILATGSVRFLSDAAIGFTSTSARSQLAAQARHTLNRVLVDVRGALPGSLRSNGPCLELIPTLGATRYHSLPVASPGLSFPVTAFQTDFWPASLDLSMARVAVFPHTNPYRLGTVASVSPTVVIGAPDGGSQSLITLASAHQFVTHSPRQRVFLLTTPRSYCVADGHLWRYDNYGFAEMQLALGSMPTSLPQRALFAENVQANFAISDATLARNGLLRLDLTFNRGTDSVAVNHLGQVRNVP